MGDWVKEREREREEGVDIHSLSRQGLGQGLVDADWLVSGGSCVHWQNGEC